jgi:undecaprenyl phosphate-alpha-L-ara4N flippase subunit ArnE
MKTVLSVVALVMCTVTANLLLKAGATAAARDGSVTAYLDIRIVAGLATFAAAAALYIWVLGWMPLHAAQSFLAAQYVAVVAAAHLVFAEPMPPLVWLGIGLIAAGIAVIGYGRP